MHGKNFRMEEILKWLKQSWLQKMLVLKEKNPV